MQSAWIAIALVAFLVAGCFTPPSAPPTPEASQSLPIAERDPRQMVHNAAGTALPPDAYPGKLPTMAGRLVWDSLGGHGSFEPSIGIGPDGTAYYVAGDAPLTRTVYRTTDDGQRWQDVTPRPETGTSGDPFLHVDHTTGRVFMYDQQAYLLCDNWAISDTRGDSWNSWNTCREDGSYGDHPSIATGVPRVSETTEYPNVVYFCASIGGATSCRTSLDGGMSYGAAVQAIDACAEPDGSPGPGQSGHLATGADGKVYVAKVACGGALLGISEDDAATWRTVRINDTGWTRQKWSELNEHEASVAVDAAGTIYVVVVADDGTTKMVVSKDDGASWSAPMRVSRPDVTATNFAYVTAGDQGRVAVLYVGTTVPGGFDASAAEMQKAEWHAYAAFSLNADGEEPVFANVLVNPEGDALRRGPCWARCPVREGPLGRGVLQDSMGDFLDIDYDPRSGRVWLALVDLCHDACARNQQASPDDGAYARAYVGVQVGGSGVLAG